MNTNDQQALASFLDRMDTTAIVIASGAGGRVDACFATFVTVASMDPPRLLVLTSHVNLTHELVEQSGALAVHLMDQHLASTWIDRFGRRSGRDVDKLEGVHWRPGLTGSPVLGDAIAWLEGRVIDVMPCGDHTAHLIEPITATIRDPEARPVTNFDLVQLGLVDPRAPAPWLTRENGHPGGVAVSSGEARGV